MSTHLQKETVSYVAFECCSLLGHAINFFLLAKSDMAFNHDKNIHYIREEAGVPSGNLIKCLFGANDPDMY
jgi:hypothetical protein